MSRSGVIIFIFGALDLLAFYRCFPKVTRMFEDYTPSIYLVLLVAMIISLLVSGPLIMLGKKIGYFVYYFQFPIRLTFLASLTFGFIFKFFPTETGTLKHGMVLAFVYGLEAVRLMLTIQKNKALL